MRLLLARSIDPRRNLAAAHNRDFYIHSKLHCL